MTYIEMTTTIRRCNTCSKKTLLPIECKCKKWFCSKHKYPDAHQCDYDHHDSYKQTLCNKLKKVSASKVIKI